MEDKQQEQSKSIVLLSGGLDSTVMLHDLMQGNGVLATITFAYGQSHYKEVIAAQRIATELEVPWRLVDFTPVVGAGDSLLTGGKGSPVVVNRNATMLSLAVTYAAGIGASAVFIAPTKEDYDLFPDCRPAFFKRFNRMLEIAEVPVHVETPYIHKTKRDVVSIGRKMNVDFSATWSCYTGGNKPCGECLACTTREAALEG